MRRVRKEQTRKDELELRYEGLELRKMSILDNNGYNLDDERIIEIEEEQKEIIEELNKY